MKNKVVIIMIVQLLLCAVSFSEEPAAEPSAASDKNAVAVETIPFAKVTIRDTAYTVQELRGMTVEALRNIVYTGVNDRSRITESLDLGTNNPAVKKEPYHVVVREIFRNSTYFTTNNIMELNDLDERARKSLREKSEIFIEVKRLDSKYKALKSFHDYFAKEAYTPEKPLEDVPAILGEKSIGEVLTFRYDQEIATKRLNAAIRKTVFTGTPGEPEMTRKQSILELIEASSRFTMDSIASLDKLKPAELSALKEKDKLIDEIFETEKSIHAELMLLRFLTGKWSSQ